MPLESSEEQIAALLEKDQNGPINMLNLLKCNEFAGYADGSEAELSGREAYMRYGVKVAQLLVQR